MASRLPHVSHTVSLKAHISNRRPLHSLTLVGRREAEESSGRRGLEFVEEGLYVSDVRDGKDILREKVFFSL